MELPELPLELSEFLRCMNSTGVDYLVIGGVAVAVHGFVRATGDIDILVRDSAENARRMVAALELFGFGSTQLSEELFTKPRSLVTMGVAPAKIDIINYCSGVTFDECWQARQLAKMNGDLIPVVSLEYLRRLKEAAGRPQDLVDLARLADLLGD